MIHLDQSFLKNLGVVDWGTTSELSPVSFDHYDSWVKNKMHGVLGYLADERKEKRKSLDHVVKGTQSAIVFLFSYKEVNFYYKNKFKENRMASYALAYGDNDYHYVIKEYLAQIIDELKKQFPDENFTCGIDTWPILERDLAYRAGLGWFGKNSMLINQKEGSFFFIGSILTSLKLDNPKKLEIDHCGHCHDCVVACPTLAIDPETRTLNANQCISTFTIELFKEAEAPEGIDKSNGEIFGCDICQDVCPWNIKLSKEPLLKAVQDSKLFNFFLARPLEKVFEELQTWSNKKFVKEFKGSVVERTGRIGLLKNIKFYLK